MSLADRLRDLESEVERDHPGNEELLADLSRMICDLETGAATYFATEDGEVVRVPNERR
jgi:hypothetical protein